MFDDFWRETWEIGANVRNPHEAICSSGPTPGLLRLKPVNTCGSDTMGLHADSTLTVACEPASGLLLGLVRGASIYSSLPFEWDSSRVPYRHRHVKGAVLIADDSRVRFLVEARSRTCQLTRYRWKKRDLERFSQALKGRFLGFAPISSVSPQKSSHIHAIYQECIMSAFLMSFIPQK